MKKIILLFLLLFFMCSAFATQTISDYKIPTSAKFMEKITVRGFFNDTLADSNNILCRFDVFDSNGNFVERLSDEVTYLDGSFSTERTLTEPPYWRGEDFNIQTTCKSATATATFSVGQRETLFQPLLSEFQYVTDMGNIAPFFFVLIFFFVVIGIPVLTYSWFKSRGGG